MMHDPKLVTEILLAVMIEEPSDDLYPHHDPYNEKYEIVDEHLKAKILYR